MRLARAPNRSLVPPVTLPLSACANRRGHGALLKEGEFHFLLLAHGSLLARSNAFLCQPRNLALAGGTSSKNEKPTLAAEGLIWLCVSLAVDPTIVHFNSLQADFDFLLFHSPLLLPFILFLYTSSYLSSPTLISIHTYHNLYCSTNIPSTSLSAIISSSP